MAWCRQATSHYLNRCWPRSPTPCRPQWVKGPLSTDIFVASELVYIMIQKYPEFDQFPIGCVQWFDQDEDMRLRPNGHCFADDILRFFFFFFSCDQAALWMVFSVRLSVCPSVRLSVRLSHLFDYVPIIVSSWNFQELSHWTRVRSMQKVKVRGQRSRSQRSRPKFSFPDCNSSLNSHMMMKWYI